MLIAFINVSVNGLRGQGLFSEILFGHSLVNSIEDILAFFFVETSE